MQSNQGSDIHYNCSSSGRAHCAQHGVPVKLSSDRDAAFLSKFMEAVYSLLEAQMTNTTSYHPQTDGLVKRFNRTVTNMLAKKVKKKNGRDWDVQLSHVLFAYRSSPQESTGESPFSLMYGRDPVLSTADMLVHPDGRIRVSIDDYKEEIIVHGKLQEIIYGFLSPSRNKTVTNIRKLPLHV